MLPIARVVMAWRGDDDAVAADGVAMAMTVLPTARRWRWRGDGDAADCDGDDGDDVATKFELAMAMAMMLRPTALRWQRQCCRRLGRNECKHLREGRRPQSRATVGCSATMD